VTAKILIVSVPLTSLAPTVNLDELTLTQHQKDVVIGFRIFAAFCSFFGSVFVLFSMVFFARLKRMSTRLIFFLTLANLGESFANMLSISIYGHEEAFEGKIKYSSGIQDSGTCVFQGFILQATQIAIFCWITIIAVNLFFVVVTSKDTRSHEYWYHAAVVLVTVLLR
jgi:hypothetical protein